MATTGALNQLVKGLHGGFNAGMDYGEQIGNKMATRKVSKAEQELEEYLRYDPTQPPGAMEGGQVPGKPTVRDLYGLQDQMREAARLSNDPDFQKNADLRWAQRLKDGYNTYVDQASALIKAGDDDGAARALEHAGGLIPNGQHYQVRRNKQGQLVIKGFDDDTGQPTDEKILGDKELLHLKISMDDPAKALELINSQAAEAMSRRQQLIEGARAGREEERDVQRLGIETSEARAKNTKAYAGANADNARADLYGRTDPNLRSAGGSGSSSDPSRKWAGAYDRFMEQSETLPDDQYDFFAGNGQDILVLTDAFAQDGMTGAEAVNAAANLTWNVREMEAGRLERDETQIELLNQIMHHSPSGRGAIPAE